MDEELEELDLSPTSVTKSLHDLGKPNHMSELQMFYSLMIHWDRWSFTWEGVLIGVHHDPLYYHIRKLP